MWLELIQYLNNNSDEPDETLEFFPPAKAKDIAAAEQELQIRFPDQLKSLLLETDGVFVDYGIGFVWSIFEIIDYNNKFRTDKKWIEAYGEGAFNHILFFSDAGNGDQYFFSAENSAILDETVYRWRQESNSQEVVAASLKEYVERAFH